MSRDHRLLNVLLIIHIIYILLSRVRDKFGVFASLPVCWLASWRSSDVFLRLREANQPIANRPTSKKIYYLPLICHTLY